MRRRVFTALLLTGCADVSGFSFSAARGTGAVFDKSSSLLYVPPSSITASPGSSVGTLASVYGSNALAASPTPPTVQANAVGGQNAAWYPNDGAPYQYLTCNALAGTFRPVAGSWTLLLRNRVDKEADQPLMSLMRSDGGTADKLSIRVTNEATNLWRVSGGVTQFLTTPRSPDPYSDTMIAVSCDAGYVTISERFAGQSTERITALGLLTGADLPSANDNLTFGASIWTAVGEIMTGYQNGWGIWASALANSDIHSVFDEWQTQSPSVTQVSGYGVITPGDSIMVGPGDQVTGAGMRDFLSDYWVREGIDGFYTYGGIQAGGSDNGYGVGRQGVVRNTFTSCLSGQRINQIVAQALLDIADSPVPVRFWHCYMGGGDNIDLVSPSTLVSRFVAGFETVMDAMIATEGSGGAKSFAFISPIIPIDTTTPSNVPIQANLVAYYALWPGVVSTLQSIYPGRVYPGDMYAALGGVAQVPKYFNNDSTGLAGHPNRPGYAVMMLDPLNGAFNAKNELGQTLAQRFRAMSASGSARPVALSGSILTPAPGASIAHGSTQTFTFDCSRLASTPRLKVDGVVKGVGVAVDSNDYVAFLGAWIRRPHNTFTFDWITGSGDVGSHTVTVEYTDVDGVTVATAAGIAFTVT